MAGRALATFLLAIPALGQQSAVAPYASTDGRGRSLADASYNSKISWFMPLARPNYVDGISSMPTTTNARNISNIIFSQPPFAYNKNGVAAFAAAWGQFVAHDMVMTSGSPGGINATANDNVQVVIPTGDPDMDPDATGTQRLNFRRNIWDLATGTSTANPRRQINSQTGWIDASTVYGVDASRTADLRTFNGGLLISDPINGCPYNRRCVDMASGPNSPCDQRLAGDPRANVAPGIFTLHGLFVLEHNWWAKKFAADNPTWDDETLFQEARKRVIAEIQSINTNQYLTVVLGEPLAPYRGYNASVDPRVSGTFAVAAYRYGHSGIDSMYFCVKADGSTCPSGHLLLREHYFDPSYLEWGATISDIMRGMYVQLESAIDTAMVPDVRNKVEGFKKDLAAWDILRGRDFGVPSFVQARRDLGLSVPTRFTDITSNGLIARTLEAAYSGDVNAVDLWVGGLAESATSNGKFMGPTFRAIIKDQFQRTRDGDWYWYENTANIVTTPSGGTKRYFSDAEIAEISSTTLGKIISRNTDWTSAPDNVFITSAKFAFSGSTAGAATTAAAAASPSPAAVATGSSGTGANAATAAGTTTTTLARVAINSLIGLEWTPPAASDTSITLTVYFAGDGWLGMGLGATGMIGSDIWLMRRTGSGALGGEVTDTKATSYVTPAADGQQDVTLVSCTRTNGRTAFVLRRSLNTGDANDYPITATGMNVIFAWDPASTTYAYHGSNRIQTSINFLAPPAASLVTVTTSANGTSNDTGVFAGSVDLGDAEALQRAALLNSHGWHGVSMFLVWGVLVPAGSLAVRFLKHRPSHQAFHKWAMLTAATITLPAAGGALAQSANRPTTLAHAQLGMTIAGVLLLQVVMGAMIRNWLTETKLPPWYWQYVKHAHRGLGWAMLIGGLANCSLGADMLIKNGKWVVFGYGALLVIVVVVLMGLDEYMGRQRKGQPSMVTLDGDQGRRMSMSQSKLSLTMTELRANVRAGSKWVIMQGYIYDIGQFIKHHPGGAYLLERCIGHDVTQFFFGRESFDSHTRPYAHSERAHKLLRTMCVAALKADVVSRSWADAPTLDDAECTDKWVVSKRTVIDADSRRPVVKLELQHPSATAVPAADWLPSSFGRHMVAKASVATIRQVLASAGKEAARGEGSGLGRLLSRRSASVAPAHTHGREREREWPASPPLASPGGPHGLGSKGSVTGNVPDHVKTAMDSWYARSRRYRDGGDMTPSVGGLASPGGFGHQASYGPGPAGRRSGVRSESPAAYRRGPPGSSVAMQPLPSSMQQSSVTMQHYSHHQQQQQVQQQSFYGPTGGPQAPAREEDPADYGGPASAGGYSYGHHHSSRYGTGSGSSGRYSPDALDDLKPGEVVVRPYSIVRGDNKPGLIMYIRRYPRGAMSPYMFALREGDEVTLSGPKGLGLHLDNNQSGVVVGIYQGTCVVAAFDILQFIYAQCKERKRAVAAENANNAIVLADATARRSALLGATSTAGGAGGASSLAFARQQQAQAQMQASLQGDRSMIGVTDVTPTGTGTGMQMGRTGGLSRTSRGPTPVGAHADTLSTELQSRDGGGGESTYVHAQPPVQSTSAAQQRASHAQAQAAAGDDHDLQQLLFAMPEPVGQTRVPASSLSLSPVGVPRSSSSAHDPMGMVTSRAAGEEGPGEEGGSEDADRQYAQDEAAGEGPDGGAAARGDFRSSAVGGRQAGASRASRQQAPYAAPAVDIPGALGPEYEDDADEGAPQGPSGVPAASTSRYTGRPTLAAPAPSMTTAYRRPGAATAAGPAGGAPRPMLPPIRAPGKRSSVDMHGMGMGGGMGMGMGMGLHGQGEYPISVSTTENDAVSMTSAAGAPHAAATAPGQRGMGMGMGLAPGVGNRPTLATVPEGGGKPHLRLVLMVVAENEDAVIELEWLRHMDAVCEDFELHLNLKAVKDPYQLADFPRVHSGRLNPKKLESLLPPTELLTVSVCGTPQFQREVSELYRSMGLPRSLLTVVS